MTDPKNPDDAGKDNDRLDDEWAEAMQAQQGEGGDSESSDQSDDDIDWGAAFAESGETPEHSLDQNASEESASSSQATSDQASAASDSTAASDSIFQPLVGADGKGPSRELDVIMDIPVTLSVELGRTRLTIRELLDLAKGSVVELEGLAGEPMNILINGYLIAQGEVVVVDDKYGVRITDIITPSERIHKLNR